VYTGRQAQPIKLVDEYGGLNAVIDEAARRMKLPAGTKVELVELPRKEGSLLGPLGALAKSRSSAALEELGRAAAPILEPLVRSIPASLLLSPRSMQARMPFGLHWK
jgi:ClpP class serine protease